MSIEIKHPAGGGSGDVTGPGSATDNAIVRFDGTGGKTLQNSGITIDDSDNLVLGGTADEILFKGSSGEITSDANFVFEPTTEELGIGTPNPTNSIHVLVNSSGATPQLKLDNDNALGDASINFESSTKDWCVGVDANKSYKFKISNNASLGSGDIIICTDFADGTKGRVCGILQETPERSLHVGGSEGMRLDTSALPGSPAAGDIVIDSGNDNRFTWHDGTNWQSPFNLTIADTENRSVTITQSDTTNDPVALSITQNSNSASNIFAISITSDNAGAGVPGGIDLSSFSVDEPIVKAVADSITVAGTVSHQIAIDIGGTIYYLVAYTHGT